MADSLAKAKRKKKSQITFLCLSHLSGLCLFLTMAVNLRVKRTIEYSEGLMEGQVTQE